MLNGAEFISIAAAIAALPLEGGSIYLPSKQDSVGHVVPYVISATVTVDRPVRFVGDGPSGTQIITATTNPTYPMFDVRTSFVQFEKLRVCGRATASADTGSSADCIRISGLGVSGHLAQRCVLRDCEVDSAARNGLRALDAITFEGDNCSFLHSRRDGVYIDMGNDTTYSATVGMRFMNCSMSFNNGRGVYLPRNGTGITFINCVFEGNEGGHGATDGSGLTAKAIFHLGLYSCYFETFPQTGPGQFLYFGNCQSVVVEGCDFIGASMGNLHRAAKFENCAWARFANNVAQFDSVEMVSFDSECNGAVEFGNRDLHAGAGRTARIAIAGRGVTSLSSGAVNLGRFYRDNLPHPGTTAGTALPGSLVWVENAVADSGQTRVRVSDGTSWRNLVVGSAKRSVWLPATIMRTRTGTNTVGDAGTYPNRYSYISWPDGSTNAVGIETMLPPDFDPTSVDSVVTFRIVWSYDDASQVDANWFCELNVVTRAQNQSLTGTGITHSQLIPADPGAVNNAFYTNFDSFPGVSSLKGGDVLRLNIARKGLDGSDNYSGTVRLIGLVMEYKVH